jgi:hypothetical protein
VDGKLIPVCSKNQGNQGYKIREEPLESGREKVSRLRQQQTEFDWAKYGLSDTDANDSSKIDTIDYPL